jgi:hypothetical protein
MSAREQRANTTGFDNGDENIHALLVALKAQKYIVNLRGHTLRSLANLSSEDLVQLGLPRGPLVRLRAALASGLWEKIQPQQSSQVDNKDQKKAATPSLQTIPGGSQTGSLENPWQASTRQVSPEPEGSDLLRALNASSSAL